MSGKRPLTDYESVVRARPARWWEDEAQAETDWPAARAEDEADWPSRVTATPDTTTHADETPPATLSSTQPAPAEAAPVLPQPMPQRARLKRGHAISYLGLFLFTFVVYFRPYELFPSLSSLTSLAFWLAVATCLAFVPSQLAAEGTLTVRPREVNLVLLLCLAGLLSIPLAIEPLEAWTKFVDFIKVIAMFIVMVNVVRTERRLKWLILLALAVSFVLSVGAINDYRLGNFGVKGERINGIISNLFDNPNDLALHLVTMIPIAAGLFFMSRGPHKKIFYGAGVILMTVATIFTFSRGGFLALLVAVLVMAWKLGRRSRLSVIALALFLAVAFFALAPGSYSGRMASILDNGLDTSGSATSRQNLLLRSILVTARHPLLGIGMNNFHIVSIHEQVSHNAYTEVGAEMGVPAMIVYILFILASIKRMRAIERETFERRRNYRAYYLAVGLQASIISYMVSSFFASVAYQWYIYYLVGYAFCLYRLHEAGGIRSRKIAAPRGHEEQPQPPNVLESAQMPGRAAAFTGQAASEQRRMTING
jgi:putative inorganic carbon (hco3(-)) transporter